MKKIGNRLSKHGYRVHVINSLRRNTLPIKTSAELVEDYIAKNDLHDLIIISHSKGGLIARFLINKTSRNTIKQVITIASPHHGTTFAKLRLLNLTELLPNSSMLRTLAGQDVRKIINIYPSFDSTVLPNESLVLDGARNIRLKTSGHTKILESEESLNLLGEVLITKE